MDVSGPGILDGYDMSLYGSLNAGIFECEIAIRPESAVLHDQVVAIAKWLGLGNMAAD